VDGIKGAKLKISSDGHEFYWIVEPSSLRLLQVRATSTVYGTTVTDLSDWRQVGGIRIAFKRHSVDNSRTTDITLSEAEVNPTVDAKLFQPPTQQITDNFTFRVLQEESVPYVVQSGGGVSTNCQITGTTTTTRRLPVET